jgi:hypothetical protein
MAKHVIYVRSGWGVFAGRHYLYHEGKVLVSVCCIGAFARALVRHVLGPGDIEFHHV